MDGRMLLVGLVSAGVGLAWGADAPDPGPKRLRCRSFATEPGAAVDTRDASTELGRWVLGLEDQGWQIATVDFTVGEKPTGYAQGWTHACLEPVPAR